MDPLEIPTLNACNKRGRPRSSDIICFSAPPKSLAIAEMIKKTSAQDTESCNIAPSKSVEPSDDTSCIEQQPTECSKRKTKEPQKVIRKKSVTQTQHFCDYPGCSYSCKLSCNLLKHKRIHAAEKPYLCDQCTFRSNFVNSLKVHKRLHNMEKPFECKQCSYRCNSSSNLKKHSLHRHPEISKT